MSRNEKHGHNVRLTAVVVAVLLVLGGAAALVVGVLAQQSPPQPPASAAATRSVSPTATPTGQAASVPGAPVGTGSSKPTLAPGAVPPLPASVPVHVDVPAIGVSSDLLQLGQNPDGTVQVPPLAKDSRAGWYRYSPTPGELGPAVILGHVDSAEYGPGVFFKLGALRPGDTVTVTRADHTAAVFRVDRVASYPKDDFPTLQVYGNTDQAELRLITCGGDFDYKTRNYLNNIVAYATLVGSHPA